MALRIVRKMDELQREIGKLETMSHDIKVFLNGLELLEENEHNQANKMMNEKIDVINSLIDILGGLKESLEAGLATDTTTAFEVEIEKVTPLKPKDSIRIVKGFSHRSRR